MSLLQAWPALLILAGAPDAGTRAKPKGTKAHAMVRDQSKVAASLKAAQGDDPKARSDGFLTLSQQGVEKKIPDPEPNVKEPRCVELKSDGACATKVTVCNRAEEIDADETHYSNVDRFVGFGLTAADATDDLPKHLMSRARKSGPDELDTQCVVVFLDGCHRRAGMVCTTATGRAGVMSDEPPKTEVFDLSF